MKKAIVLGAGPAGLIAAEALNAEGIEVVGIYSEPEPVQRRPLSAKPNEMVRKSVLYGAQYLHGALHGSRVRHSTPFDVRFEVNGSPDEYAMKVYGPGHPFGSSADKYRDGYRQLGWDVREAYDQLWNLWQHKLMPSHITAQFMYSIIAEYCDDGYHLVSTLPRNLTCAYPEGHVFRSQNIYAIGGPAALEFAAKVPSDTIQMNGLPNPRWYRAAKIQGHVTVEWPGGQARPPIENVVPVSKPLTHTCTCWSAQNVSFFGRYGAWQKSVLLHEVYDEAKKLGSRLRVES